jgi:hypothetical protein
VEAAFPPRFREGVWQRIAHEEATVRPNFLSKITCWLEMVFRRPLPAASYVAILLFVGVTVGFWQGNEKSAQAESQWRARYIQSVDPYQMPRY